MCWGPISLLFLPYPFLCFLIFYSVIPSPSFIHLSHLLSFPCSPLFFIIYPFFTSFSILSLSSPHLNYFMHIIIIIIRFFSPLPIIPTSSPNYPPIYPFSTSFSILPLFSISSPFLHARHHPHNPASPSSSIYSSSLLPLFPLLFILPFIHSLPHSTSSPPSLSLLYSFIHIIIIIHLLSPLPLIRPHPFPYFPSSSLPIFIHSPPHSSSFPSSPSLLHPPSLLHLSILASPLHPGQATHNYHR